VRRVITITPAVLFIAALVLGIFLAESAKGWWPDTEWRRRRGRHDLSYGVRRLQGREADRDECRIEFTPAPRTRPQTLMNSLASTQLPQVALKRMISALENMPSHRDGRLSREELCAGDEERVVFTWFQRGAEYLRYEARAVSNEIYELTIIWADGTERVEQFTDQIALHERQLRLQRELEGAGWTGPHGWNV
jgi:hypothetical protein